MQMLKKIFNSDKKYYLELDEKLEDIKESEVVQTAVQTASKASEAVQDKISEVAKSEPVKEAAKAAGDVVETAQDKLSSAISTDEKPVAKDSSAKKEAKVDTPEPVKKEAKVDTSKPAKKAAKGKEKVTPDEVKAKSAPEKPAEKQTPESAGASSFDPPFWVAAMNNTNTKNINSNGQAGEPTFATDNLMPIATKYRRRPGGSLNKFKDMAKTVKTPRR